ncbi:MAG: DUF1461 domain-containing protein [Luteimonas sp.]
MTTVRASATLSGHTSAASRASSVASALVAPATMVVILAVVLLLLMTPIWTHFAIAASGGAEAVQTPALAFQLSDRTVAELILGPGTFGDYAADEAGHMRDVRLVLFVFLGLAMASAAFLAWQVRRTPRDPRTWLSIARGGFSLALILVLLGVFAALAFGVAFELFHRILFPGGNWAFAADSLLIRLYPYAFWQLSAGALGILGVIGGLMAWHVARRRARSLAHGTAR